MFVVAYIIERYVINSYLGFAEKIKLSNKAT